MIGFSGYFDWHHAVSRGLLLGPLLFGGRGVRPLSWDRVLPFKYIHHWLTRKLRPMLTTLLPVWYKRRERQARIALLFSAASLAGAFGGILAWVPYVPPTLRTLQRNADRP